MSEPWEDEVFELLEPPSGGLSALRARIEAEAPRRRLAWSFGLAAAAVATVVTLLWWPVAQPPPEVESPVQLASHPALVRLGLEPAPEAPVSVPEGLRGEMAVSPMAGGSEGEVLLYWVAPARR